MNCSAPIDPAVLADYWLAALTEAEQESVEQHLFTCDDCGARLRETVAMAEGIRNIAQDGTLLMVVSDAFLKRAAEQGVRIREYCPPNGGSVECTVRAEDDLLVGRLESDLRGAKRIDLRICDPGGVERFRLPDIPFDPSAGSIAFQQSITYSKAAPSETIVARLVSMDDSGGERLLGEYTFHHRRTLPGPGAW